MSVEYLQRPREIMSNCQIVHNFLLVKCLIITYLVCPSLVKTNIACGLQINWRPVIWGFTLQFVIGILVLRWKPGYEAVQWLSDEIMKFIYYSLEGAAVVFGDPMLILHPYVFVVSIRRAYLLQRIHK